MVVDYSKWETLANEEAKSEELERQRLRDERHAKYLKQQQEKWEKVGSTWTEIHHISDS